MPAVFSPRPCYNVPAVFSPRPCPPRVCSFQPTPHALCPVQRFRFATSLLYCACTALEYATPLAPRHFLAMAAAANIGKSCGLATYISTEPAFQRSFCRGENLADISAKTQVGGGGGLAP